MFTLVLSLIILASILLVLVILAQNSKGGGLSSQFGGSGASNMIGVKKTGDLLEKMTWGLAISIFILALATNFLLTERQGPVDEFRDRAQEEGGTMPTLDLGDIEGVDQNDGTGNSELEDLPADSVE
ncbi:MAG: preprotein translocase subunit SecG [Fulvivirga sp.]